MQLELDNLASVILYLSVFLTAIVFAYVAQKKKSKYYLILAILLPVFLAGFRYSAGTDSLTYRQLYTEIGTESSELTAWRITSGGLEPFIVILSMVCNFLHLPASSILIIFALITASFFYATARLFNKEKAWMYYGMLLLILFPESLNMTRQLAATSVLAFALMYSIRRLQANKKTHWWLIVLLAGFAITLHYSSVILLPVLLLPIIIKTIRGRSLAVLLSTLAVICIFGFSIAISTVVDLGLLSERHLATFEITDGSLINIKFFSSLILVAVLFASYHRRQNKDDKYMGLLLLLGVAYSAIGFYSGYLGRLAMLFWVFIILVGGDTICQTMQKENHRSAACLAVAILYFILYFCVLGFNELIPYSFIV